MYGVFFNGKSHPLVTDLSYLICRKNNEDMIKYRQRASDLLSSRESSLMSFYISKQWINKFNTFAECGPITNYDFLCAHGGKLKFTEKKMVQTWKI